MESGAVILLELRQVSLGIVPVLDGRLRRAVLPFLLRAHPGIVEVELDLRAVPVREGRIAAQIGPRVLAQEV